MNDLEPIVMRERDNYIAFFLTLDCNLACDYCINRHPPCQQTVFSRAWDRPASDWIAAANRLVLPEGLPITLQGGEPTFYSDFYTLVQGVDDPIKFDLLTNLEFDVNDFIRRVPVYRFVRVAPYPSIRATYHPGYNNIEKMIQKTLRLMNAGFKIGIYATEYPDTELTGNIRKAQDLCKKEGIDFRTKEFLGYWRNRLYGTYKYDLTIAAKQADQCLCRTCELLVGPDAHVYRCHADLYNRREPIGNILDREFRIEEIDRFRPCDYFGTCNPCDIKITTNKNQQFGHTSVTIKALDDPGYDDLIYDNESLQYTS